MFTLTVERGEMVCGVRYIAWAAPSPPVAYIPRFLTYNPMYVFGLNF
jgi:hypothetical protein